RRRLTVTGPRARQTRDPETQRLLALAERQTDVVVKVPVRRHHRARNDRHSSLVRERCKLARAATGKLHPQTPAALRLTPAPVGQLFAEQARREVDAAAQLLAPNLNDLVETAEQLGGDE